MYLEHPECQKGILRPWMHLQQQIQAVFFVYNGGACMHCVMQVKQFPNLRLYVFTGASCEQPCASAIFRRKGWL